MNVSIKNLGAIRTGVFDFEKKISVFAGVNNTGKTYMSYMIDALCSSNFIIEKKAIRDKNYLELIADDSIFIKIDLKILNKLVEQPLTRVRKNLPSVFGISEDTANELFSELEIGFEQFPFQEVDILPLEISQRVNIANTNFVLSKEKNSLSAIITLESNSDFKIDSTYINSYAILIIYALYSTLSRCLMPGAVIFPVERIAIPTFKTELLLQRSKLVDEMLEVSGKPDSPSIINTLLQNAKRYPNAIRETLDMAYDLYEIQKLKSVFYETAVEIERQLLHGEISSDKNNDIVFAHRQGGHKIPVHISASIVKSFAHIIFFLKHLAKPGQLIIIDEPEMNLHPEGQRLFVQLMIQLANKGLSFLISTHSDYIIREISNTILDTRCRRDQAAYPLLEEDVAVYNFAYTDDSLVDMAPVSFGSYGYEIPSLNAAIDAQNAFFDELLEHTDSHG